MPTPLRLALPLLCLILTLTGCAATGGGEPGEPGGPPCAVVDGIRVPYTDLGSGPDAVVFIHGWACDRSFWDAQLSSPEMARGRRLIAIDLPGHGQSDKPKVTYDMDLFVRAIVAVMDKADVERAVLVGHSNGTPMIRQMLRVHPERVAGLIVVDGALRNYFRNASEWEEFIDPLRGSKYKQNAGKLVDDRLKGVSDEALRDRIRRTMLSTPQWVMVSAMEAVSDPALWAEDLIKVPVLVMVAKSPFWNDNYKQFVQRLAPRSEYYVMEDASHFFMMDKPDEFNTVAAMWLESIGF